MLSCRPAGSSLLPPSFLVCQTCVHMSERISDDEKKEQFGNPCVNVDLPHYKSWRIKASPCIKFRNITSNIVTIFIRELAFAVLQ